ncbi:acetyltransferase [Paenibacillus chitinolyticus]|uniref:GNAT family N-acetyltransferase n=1 Tax=Paenibacillus chitinolyticus TaxID=79263 RepID=UPI0026E4AC46|nr:GNAT family N-acetyltransferase [Paenibacillus chitinolyticus]GKS15030.1 acetyltransferase [Paenibacillus chitinolyticus]
MEIRTAQRGDLEEIVRLLADDELGSQRERYEEPLPPAYEEAFSAITGQTGNSILVAEISGKVVGCLQLTLIPGLARMGMTRAQVEGVRVDSRYRGHGIGKALLGHAIETAKVHGCGLVQLTTDKTRGDAHRFYGKLGFTASHEGMKFLLD